MNKLAFILIAFMACSVQLKAQPPAYEDLANLYQSQSYDSLLVQARAYTFQRDSIPAGLAFYYLSKTSFLLSEDEENQEISKPFNASIRYAKACARDDIDSSIQMTHSAHFTELKETLLKQLRSNLEIENYDAVRRTCVKIQQVDKSDIGTWFLYAMAAHKSGVQRNAIDWEVNARKRIESVKNTENWRPVDFAVLKLGVEEYAKYLNEHSRFEESDELYATYLKLI